VPSPHADRVCVKNVVLPFRVFPGLVPVLGPEMQSTGESMGIGRTFASAYWKAWLGAGLKQLPFGKPVYVGLSNGDAGPAVTLVQRLAALGCRVLTGPGCSLRADDELPPFGGPMNRAPTACAPGDIDVTCLGMVIVLSRSDDDLALLRRAVDAGVPHVTTSGGLRGLALALEEGEPCLTPFTG
jgi:carbamoyl-phosphate synthase large subunit